MNYFKATILQAGLGIALMTVTGLPAVAGPDIASSLRQGLPGRRISGGSRSECLAQSPPVVALSPETNLGKTLSDSPSVYFMVPALEENYLLEFSLRDSDGNRIYEKALNTDENQGVVGIQLPPQSLAVNEDYRWYFSVVCDAHDVFQNDVLSGWLRQVDVTDALTLSASVSALSDIEDGLALVRDYQSAELWTDAISTLVSLHEQYPTEQRVRDAWTQLLQALAVDDVVDTSVAIGLVSSR